MERVQEAIEMLYEDESLALCCEEALPVIEELFLRLDRILPDFIDEEFFNPFKGYPQFFGEFLRFNGLLREKDGSLYKSLFPHTTSAISSVAFGLEKERKFSLSLSASIILKRRFSTISASSCGVRELCSL